MTALTVSAFSAATKLLYPDGLEELWLPECPTLAMIPKSYDFEGASRQVRVIHAGIRASNTFSTALAGKSTPAMKDFTVTRVKAYVLGSVDNEVIAASKSDKGAVARALDTQIKSATYSFGRMLAHQFWGNGGGALARTAAASAFSTTACTLLNAEDAIHFEVGQEVVVSAADGTSGALRAGTATVTGINRTTGVLTSDANWTTQIAAAANSDYLFAEGSWGSATCLRGLLGYIPVTAPTSGDAFWGVDRSVDVERLAGQRVSGSGAPVEETVFDAQAQAAMYGGRPDLLVVHPKRMAELRKNMHSKAWQAVEAKSSNSKVSFSAIGFAGPKGDIVCIEDANCPYAYGMLMEKDSWELAGLGQIPHFSEEDGNKFLRESSDDAIEFRLKFYGNLICHRPVGNVLITW